VGIRQREVDSFHDTLDLARDVAVREAQYSITTALQSLIASRVSLTMPIETMLMAIHLHNQKRFATLEIDDIRLERRLPAEMMAQRAQLTKAKP